MDSHLKSSRDYFSLVLGEELYGIKRTDGWIQVAHGRGNSFKSCLLRKVDGEWRVFGNPLMPETQISNESLETVYRNVA